MTTPTAPLTAPVTPAEPPYGPVPDTDGTAVVAHPDWCDPTRCTADLATTMGGAHLGTPITITAGGALDDLTVTVGLYQAHARWLTAVLVRLDMTGRGEHWQPATLTATVSVEEVGDLARILTDLAASGSAWQTRQTEDYLTAQRAHVHAKRRAGTSSNHDDPTGRASDSSARNCGSGGAA